MVMATIAEVDAESLEPVVTEIRISNFLLISYHVATDACF